MPELPEIETIRRGLAPLVVGRTIAAVEVRERRLRTPVASDFAAQLEGRRVIGMDRHGKFLLARLDDGHIWLIHLGMSGQFTAAAEPAAPRPHDHVTVRFEHAPVLTYNDPRRFGRLAVIPHEAVATEAGSGVDALAPDLDGEAVFRLSRHRRTSIKAFLMDQRLIAGLGNIYVSELLFRAGVRPRRRAGGLSRRDCHRIVAAMREVLDEAIRAGGSSISDYRNGFGEYGTFQSRHRVYDRHGQPCVTCGAAIRGVMVVGRSTFYCPRCQR